MTIKKRAENDLRMYRVRKSTMEGLSRQIIEEKESARELRAARSVLYHKIMTTERGLVALNDQQRRILEVFFIYRHKEHVWELCDELLVESAEVYRRKDDALRVYIRAAYGIEV